MDTNDDKKKSDADDSLSEDETAEDGAGQEAEPPPPSGTPSEKTAGEDPETKVLIKSINIRSTALVLLTTVATLYFIEWAQAVLLPLVVSVLLSYALDPLVSLLERLHLPRVLSAALILSLLVGILGLSSVPLKEEAAAMLDKVPVAMDRFQRTSNGGATEESMVEKAQKAAKKIEATAAEDDDNNDTPIGVTPVMIVDKPLDIKQYMMQGSSAAIVLITQCFSVLLLVFFLLSVGSLYKRKVVRISGPSFGRMRKAVWIMNDFHLQVRRFLFVMLLSGIFVGILTWLAFVIMDVEQAALWGVLAGVASAIPYLGPFLVLIGSGAAAFIQFGALDMAILVGGISLGITSIQGYLLTPWLTSQMSSLNPVAIFVGLLFWGWLWGPVGLVIAMPLLMIVKSLCDHITNLRAVGELLGK
ncbi:AI-2E family transporter [Marinobacter fonticola]|uniref:AI-2E family transporter n=1 Tax=Marinobacter fonticola TaxID=2603215 RepID=UPI0011E84973|nr:AI-2E family transporter [Marinobacter fonticola]